MGHLIDIDLIYKKIKKLQQNSPGEPLMNIEYRFALADIISYLATILSSKSPDASVIKGYIGRNKDNTLQFCYHKPRRENEIEQTWWGSCDADFTIYDDAVDAQFKDLTWEDEPVKVELIIHCTN